MLGWGSMRGRGILPALPHPLAGIWANGKGRKGQGRSRLCDKKTPQAPVLPPLTSGTRPREAWAVPSWTRKPEARRRLLQVTEGYIGPFSSIKVPIIFSPVTPGTVQSGFQVTFKNQQCPTVSVLQPFPP